MRIIPVSRGVLLGLLVSFLVSVNFCSCDDQTAEVVGLGECADCEEINIKASQAFSGLRVTVECKSNKGEFQTRGVGELDNLGKFKVDLPKEILKDGKLKEECYAQLHSASAAPCPAHSGIEASKIIFQSESEGKHTFGPTGKLKFSTALCTSAFLWPHYKYPPLPKLPSLPPHPWKKDLPHYHLPPKPKIPFPPIHKKPLPPVYKPKPKPPVFKPPPVPIYKPKPKPPVFKPPPVPIYKPKPKPKPPVFKPPPLPIYKPKPKPKPPVFKPPPVPIYKKPCPPIIPHPKLPPIPKIPPKDFHHHPKFPPIPKIPPKDFHHHPKFPPKYFHHPEFGHYSPLPPYSPHP